MSTPLIVLIVAVLAIGVAGALWQRRGNTRPHRHHLVMLLLALLVILAGLGIIFTPHAHGQ